MEDSPLSTVTAAPSPSRGHDDNILRILESITDGFYGLDAEWRFNYINETGKRILSENHENPEELIGQNYFEAFPATRGTILEESFRRAVAENILTEFETFYAPWQRWFAGRCFPIRGGGLSIFFQDVTIQKEALSKLQISEERYRSLFNGIDEGFCVVEMIWGPNGEPYDYRFLEANAAMEAQTGLIDPVGKTARELVPGLESHWFEIYGQVARTGEAVRFVQGAEEMGRWFDVYAFPIDFENARRVAIRCTDITTKRQADQEIARLESEGRARLAELETLLDVLPIGIAIASDKECRNIRVNPSFAKALGLSPTDNASKTAPDAERPTNFRVLNDADEEISDTDLPMQTAAREGILQRDIELVIEHANGQRLRLLEHAAPLFDETGQPRGSVGAFVDITERRQNEDRQRFLVTMDDAVRPLSSAEEIVAVSARLLGKHLGVNRCAYADIEADEDTMNITGDYTREVDSIVGRYRFMDFGSEVLRLMRAGEPYVVNDIETHQPAPENLATYHATQIRAVICVPLQKEGKFVAAMAVHSKSPRQWSAFEVRLVLEVANRCWEALQRSRINRDLRESEARFRQIADLMPQAVWLARGDGHVDYFSRRWYDFAGDSEVDKTGDESWMPLMHPDDAQACADRWYESVHTGAPYEFRFRLREKTTGLYRWFLSRALPLRNEKDEIVRWYGSATDIDDMVKAEAATMQARAEAERANHAKDEFLATLSHELRTPLTPVLMAAESLCDDPSLPPGVHETLNMMRRNIAMEARLIDDLLDLTRITHGKLSLRLQKADAHSLIALALEIVRDEAQAKGLTLCTQLDANSTFLKGDSARLQQVFWNLLKNAVKFTPPHGHITVRTFDQAISDTSGAKTQLVIEVSDTGIGLTEETLERIFLPFEQAGLANDHRFGGLGLGLSISKVLVELHGGTISATSPGADLGSTFRVTLPVLEKQGSSAALIGTPDRTVSAPAMSYDEPRRPVSLRDTGSIPVRAVGPFRLLVVEDHQPTLAVMTKMLVRSGHQVSTAASVQAALELAEVQSFDFVISDLGLPDGSGINLMRTLNDRYQLRGIALTGYGTEEDARRSHAAGFAIHLTKPVEFAQLRKALEDISRSA